jgi:hypothetical protein
MSRLLIFGLMAIVHAVDTSAHAARLAGVRTRRLALAGSLYNVLALVGRAANALAGPLIGSLTDLAVGQHNTGALRWDFHVLLLAAAVGTLVAGLFIPTLSRLLAVGITSYEQRRSLPRVIIRGFSVRGLGRVQQSLTQPRLSAVRESRRSPFSWYFLVLSVLITALFTVANFAALYASALVPEGARTATSLAPLFTGIGVILASLFVEPVAALVTDEALRGERPLPDVTYITIWQVGARLAGTLLAQLFLGPMGEAMARLTRWLL